MLSVFHHANVCQDILQRSALVLQTNFRHCRREPHKMPPGQANVLGTAVNVVDKLLRVLSHEFCHTVNSSPLILLRNIHIIFRHLQGQDNLRKSLILFCRQIWQAREGSLAQKQEILGRLFFFFNFWCPWVGGAACL